MSWSRFLPLRYIIRKAAKNQGFLDPIEFMARLRSFAQPSEVGEPIELLRAGVVFHARGVINSKIIQYNLDWVWPYWVEKQYAPKDNSFIPRAFSASHINLTHRNWTALGYPDLNQLPLVDPRGLLTPIYDGWSLDTWIITENGEELIPSRLEDCQQEQNVSSSPAISTTTTKGNLGLVNTTQVTLNGSTPVCQLEITAHADSKAWLALALRPANPEGITFLHQLSLTENRKSWHIDKLNKIDFSDEVERNVISNFKKGDVYIDILTHQDEYKGECPAGLLTAAALFRIKPGEKRQLSVRVPLPEKPPAVLEQSAWATVKAKACQLNCPDKHYQFLFDSAITSLILHSPGDVYPGPYTYKRFWFRDAAFIINALLCVGLTERAARAIARFPERQTALGYFRSQEGEWDANGAVLWILNQYEKLSGEKLSGDWDAPIKRAANWINRKRISSEIDALHAGLLPAGFSAEHLGPNDYYYWDNFWCITGLRAAGELIGKGDLIAASKFSSDADAFNATVKQSLQQCEERLQRAAMPASPYRRLDAGAIGSLAAGYPLKQFSANDSRLLDSAEYLLENCFIDGAFFQDMIHSGLNAYLTLHVAQVLLRAKDPRYLELVDTVANLSSPTGQWPEAIHPQTKGGCMGDGHHVWASAEWVLIIRNFFIMEESDKLVLCAGIPGHWLKHQQPISFGPAPTEFGTLSIKIQTDPDGNTVVSWTGDWRVEPPIIEVDLAGFNLVNITNNQSSVTLYRS